MSAPVPQPLARRAPQEVGISPDALETLARRLQDDGLDPHALLVARGEEVVYETAWAPYRLDRPALVYSASKTFTSLAIGYLADEGRLSLDDAVGDLLAVPDAPAISVRHLLTMNSGHSAEQIERFGEDPLELLRVAPAHTPGTHFAYNSPATHALSAIVTAVSGEPLTRYLRPRLLDPLGIGDRWMSSYGGIEHGASGYHLTVEDLARTAAMLDAGGVFGGVQVAPAWYVEELSRPWSVTAEFDGPVSEEHEVNDWALGYGYQCWRSRYGFRLDGAAGQFGLVIPDRGLAIAYLGATLDTQATLRACWAFVDTVEASGAARAAVPAPAGAAELPSAAATPPAASHRDTWDARERLAIMADAPFDRDGLTLTEAAPTGAPDAWTLRLPGVGDLPVTDRWQDISLRKQGGSPETASDTAGGAGSPCSSDGEPSGGEPSDDEPSGLALATRGERRADGSVLIHVVDTTSPHRVIVQRSPGGEVTAGWHIPPLGGGWEVLRIPASVTRTTTRAAALLLDMDGTLVDSDAVVERLWTEWALAHGVDPAHTLSIIHGRQGQESMALLLPDRPHEVNLAENRALLAAETAETDGVVAIPGAADLLTALGGLPHALVTSAILPLAQARMDAAGLPIPEVAVTAEDVSRSKPDPEAFLTAARLLGVEPRDCIVVEDSANGIAAGLAAGMRVIGVGRHAAAAGPTWTVPDVSGIHVSAGGDGSVALTLDT